jgi:hypothetical protein
MCACYIHHGLPCDHFYKNCILLHQYLDIFRCRTSLPVSLILVIPEVLYHFDRPFTPTVFLSISQARILPDQAETTPRLFEMYVTHSRNFFLETILWVNFEKSWCQNRGSERLVKMIQYSNQLTASGHSRSYIVYPEHSHT